MHFTFEFGLARMDSVQGICADVAPAYVLRLLASLVAQDYGGQAAVKLARMDSVQGICADVAQR